MDDDWGLNAVVRGCSASLSAATSSSTSSPTTTTTPPTKTNPFTCDFQPFNNHNQNNAFLFTPSFGQTQNNACCTSSSYGQLFSISPSSSSDLITVSTMRTSLAQVNAVDDLRELYKPFFPKSENAMTTITTTQATPSCGNSSMVSSFSLSNSSSSSERRSVQQQPMKSNNKPLSQGGVSATTPRSKKRKNQLKKVCQVPAESLSSDIWAWRKYGQKPIKGSPYPRGYYRCSSSKGCLARKQVERNRSDPGMFIVTYTAEHNHPAPTHRNSLAGSTRQKPSSSGAVSGDSSKPSEPTKPSSPATSPEEDPVTAVQAQSGSATESKEGPDSSTMLMDDDEDDDEFGFSDMAVSDDFFVGLEGLGAPATGELFSDHFPAGFGLTWSASSAATAAGGS